MIIMPLTEDQLIDRTIAHTMHSQPYVLHTDLPGKDPMDVGQNVPAHLPDPSVGGVNASRIQNGYSTGLAKRWKRFTGQVLIAPKQSNPVQGNVGHNNRSAKLYNGVLNQLTQYTPSVADYAASYLGTTPNGQTVVTA